MKGRPKNADATAVRRGAKHPVSAPAYVKIITGEVLLAQGYTAEAVRRLEDGVGILRQSRIGFFFWGSASLAKALEQQGEWQRALRVLEEAAQERKAIYAQSDRGSAEYPWAVQPPAFFWLKIQWQRAELLRELGREPEAREIEAELRKLLAYADADHDILRKLQDLTARGGATDRISRAVHRISWRWPAQAVVDTSISSRNPTDCADLEREEVAGSSREC